MTDQEEGRKKESQEKRDRDLCGAGVALGEGGGGDVEDHVPQEFVVQLGLPVAFLGVFVGFWGRCSKGGGGWDGETAHVSRSKSLNGWMDGGDVCTQHIHT